MKTIILDIDGTLINSVSKDAELYFWSVRQVIGDVVLRDPGDYEHVTDAGILAEILQDNGYADESSVHEQVKSTFLDALRTHIEDNGPFAEIDDAARFVARIRARNDYRLAIATGGWRASALLKLESAGFDAESIPMTTSDDSPSRTRIMDLALRAAGGAFGSVTYYGDGEWDRRACSDLGWKFVAVGERLGGITSYRNIVL